jgi:hypothetical protein
MDKRNTSLLAILLSVISFGQVKMGNWMYDSQNTPVNILENNISASVSYSRNNTITIKGMFNAVPDEFVATFSLTQEGEEVVEVNKLIDDKITKIKAGLKLIDPKIILKTDVISFVPIYDHVLERKVFAKNSYVEKPKGFELKKNITIRYYNSQQLDPIFLLCTANEVYDFVRADLFTKNMTEIRQLLRERSDSMLNAQMKRYEGLLDVDYDNYNKSIGEATKVVYPAEKYLNYNAFSSTSYFTKKYNIKSTNKKVTKHYMPVIDKEFDFVYSPVVDEPTIQIMYTLTMALVEKPKEKEEPEVKTEIQRVQEFHLITPDGQVKKLNIQ